MSKRIVVFVLVNLMGLFLSFSTPMGFAQEPSLEAIILGKVAIARGVSEQRLTVASLDSVHLPVTDVILYKSKVVDLQTGEIYGVVVNIEGEEHDLLAAQQAEYFAHEQQYGRMSASFHEELSQTDGHEMVTVAIWL